MKKLLISLLIVCLCLSSAFALASCGCENDSTIVNSSRATEPEMVDTDGFGYIALSNDTLAVTQYTGTATEVEVPSEYEGKTITAVGNGTFRSTQVTSVIVPDTVTSIGERAFSNCTNLTSVLLPEGLKKINNNAFEYCFSLTSINLPSSLESLGMYAFTGSALESIEIPEKVTKLDHFTFFQCKSLESVRIPGTVTEFGDGVFQGDENLTIKGAEDTAAEEYAKTQKIRFVAE